MEAEKEMRPGDRVKINYGGRDKTVCWHLTGRNKEYILSHLDKIDDELLFFVRYDENHYLNSYSIILSPLRRKEFMIPSNEVEKL